MSEMLKRMVFAYDMKAHELAGVPYVCKRDSAKHIEAMRAALLAMREPTEEMLKAKFHDLETDWVWPLGGPLDCLGSGQVWQAMIDEALRD